MKFEEAGLQRSNEYVYCLNFDLRKTIILSQSKKKMAKQRRMVPKQVHVVRRTPSIGKTER